MPRGRRRAGFHTCGPDARTHWRQVGTAAHTCAGRGGAWRKKRRGTPEEWPTEGAGLGWDRRKGRGLQGRGLWAGPVERTLGRAEGRAAGGSALARSPLGTSGLCTTPPAPAALSSPSRVEPGFFAPAGQEAARRSSSASSVSGVPGRTCVARSGMPCPLGALRVGREGARAPLSARRADAAGPGTGSGTGAEGRAGAPHRDPQRTSHPEPA